MLNGDKIYVEDLRVKATIGIFDWEKKIKQDVSISYEIPHDNVKAAKADAIEATTDYKSITKGINYSSFTCTVSTTITTQV